MWKMTSGSKGDFGVLDQVEAVGPALSAGTFVKANRCYRVWNSKCFVGVGN